MPRGTYLLLGAHDGEPLARERFACAAGPAGWRYRAEVLAPYDDTPSGLVDLTVDGGWRQIRLEVLAAGWRLRGGVCGLEVRWVRLPADPATRAPTAGTELGERASGFTGRSPAFLVAAARLLALGAGGRARLRLAELSDALGVRAVEQAWTLEQVEEHRSDLGPLPVERFGVADVEVGRLGAVHLAGDVVVAAPGVELLELTGPPTLARHRPG